MNTNGIRDAIAPDVTIFVQYILQNNNVIRIEVTTNTFKLVLPNMNVSGSVAESVSETSEKAPVVVTPQMKMVMDYLAEYDEMTDEDLQELLNIKKTRTYLLVRQMSENGLNNHLP